MPYGNKTGPWGQGPGTGRAMGFCSGYDTPGFTRGNGAGMGRGPGFGRGRVPGRGRYMGSSMAGSFQGFPWTHTMSSKDEIALLKSQAEMLRHSQQEIEKRLSELEKEKE